MKHKTYMQYPSHYRAMLMRTDKERDCVIGEHFHTVSASEVQQTTWAIHGRLKGISEP